MKKLGKRAVERWFDQQGLPAFAVGARPLTASSTLPPLVLLSSWDLLDSAVDSLRDAAVLLQLFALVASILLPAALTWRTVRFLKKPRSRHLYAMISVAVLVVVLVAARGLGDATSHDFIGSLAVNLVIAAVLTGLSYLGVGAILAWSVRESLRQSKALREMTGRALPLFVLLTVFGFLAAEVWQFTAALAASQFWTVVAILLTATLYFSATISFTEMKDIVRSDYVKEAEAGTLAAAVSAEHCLIRGSPSSPCHQTCSAQHRRETCARSDLSGLPVLPRRL